MKLFLTNALQLLHTTNPLVHHITNYVTVNDCANMTLAVGASPIMADDEAEVADITALASALLLNIGTLNERTVASMILAGKKANQLGIPVVLDPVGAGASSFRNQTLKQLLTEIDFAVIRGNRSEIRFLAGEESHTKGVDASHLDNQTELEAQQTAKLLAKKMNCVVAITGVTDVISDGERVFLVKNGTPEMGRITGTGCMLTSLIASFCGSTPEELFFATTTAILVMGIAGELASERSQNIGTSSFRTALIDAVSQMNATQLIERGHFNETTN